MSDVSESLKIILKGISYKNDVTGDEVRQKSFDNYTLA